MAAKKPQFVHVMVPVAGGEGREADRRMRPPDRLERAMNVESPEIGTLAKRHGFTKLGNLIAGGGGDSIAVNGPVRALGKTAKELIAIGHRNLYAYVPSEGGWVERGAISPCLGEIRETFRANVQYRQADSHHTGSANKYILQAAIRYETWGPKTTAVASDPYYALELRGVDENGDTLFAPQVPVRVAYTGAGGNDVPYAVKVTGNGTRAGGTGSGAVAVYALGDLTNPAELRRYLYEAATPYTVPVAMGAGDPITADLYVRTQVRTFCCCPCKTGGYFVVFIDATARNINTRRYNAAHVQTHAVALAPPVGSNGFYAVSVCEAQDGDIYVLAICDQGEGGDDVLLWKRNNDLTGDWVGWRTMATLGALPKETGDNCGVCEGDVATNDYRAQCVWTVHVAPGASYRYDMQSRSRDDADTVFDALVTTYAVNPYTKPFFYQKRAYVGVHTLSETAYEAIGFESHMLVDLACAGATRIYDEILMAALYGVGSAPGRAGNLGGRMGSGNQFWVRTDNKTFHTMAPFFGEALRNDACDDFQYSDIRFCFDDVRFEFGAVPMSVPIHRQAAVIGGGFVSWYDGATTFELSFAKPPLIDTMNAAEEGTVDDTDHQWRALWLHPDAGGVVHRSLPGPSTYIAAPGFTTDYDISCTALPCTHRIQEDMTAQIYRNGTDAVYRRIHRTADNTPNIYTGRLIPIYTDHWPDAQLYVPLYTTGGVVESVAPEGCKIPHVTRERLWLGDFFRRDRIQFSKLAVPQSGASTCYAPELYELLGRVSGSGEEITGIGSMDSTTVVFTKTRIFLVSGYGPDARGANDDMSRLTEVPTDAGCIEPRSVVTGPDGIFFQTAKGIYLLRRGFTVEPIGEPVRWLTDSTYPVVTSAKLVQKSRQVRFTVTNTAETSGGILVYDYRIKAWFDWWLRDSTSTTIVPIGAEYVDDTYYVLRSDGTVWYENSSKYYDDVTQWVQFLVETAEIQPAGLMRAMHVRRVMMLGEYQDDHKVRVSMYYNGSGSGDYVEWDNATLLTMEDPYSREQLSWIPPVQQVQSFAIRISDYEDGTPSSGRSLEIHAVAAEVAVTDDLPHDGQQSRM